MLPPSASHHVTAPPPTLSPPLAATAFSLPATSVSSPNGDPGIDASISILAHELAEAASDPMLYAWFDSNGYENADKCSWMFGNAIAGRDSKGYTYFYNLQGVNGTKFLVQQNWDAAANTCTLA